MYKLKYIHVQTSVNLIYVYASLALEFYHETFIWRYLYNEYETYLQLS